MTAPTIWVVVRARRDLAGEIVGWCFQESQARDVAQHLNGGDEWGPHEIEEVAPLEIPQADGRMR